VKGFIFIFSLVASGEELFANKPGSDLPTYVHMRIFSGTNSKTLAETGRLNFAITYVMFMGMHSFT
jgi:hypothetical protein